MEFWSWWVAAVTDDPSTLGIDVATSYTLSLVAGPGAPERAGFVPQASVAPAGAIATNVTSLARFAAMQLAGGVASDGTRVISAENLAVTHAPQTHLAFAGAPWLTDYAAGWVVGNEGGVPVVWHDGALDGYNASLRLLPDDDVALVVLTNGWNGGSLCVALEEELMQLVHGHADRGSAYYTNAYVPVRKRLDAVAEAIALEAPIAPDAVALLLGDWGHELSFELDDNNQLFFVAPGSRGRVVRADKLFKTAGVYLLAGGPLLGMAVRVAETDGLTELSVVDPATGDAILSLAR